MLEKNFNLSSEDFTALSFLVNQYMLNINVKIDEGIIYKSDLEKAHYIDELKHKFKLNRLIEDIDKCIILGKYKDYLRVYYGFDGIRYFKFLLEETYYYCDYNRVTNIWTLEKINKKFLKNFKFKKDYKLNSSDINYIFNYMYKLYPKKCKFSVSSLNNDFNEKDKIEFINKQKKYLKSKIKFKFRLVKDIDIRNCYILGNKDIFSNVFLGFDGKNFFKFEVPSVFSYTFNSNKNSLKFILRKDTMYGDED